MNTRLQLVLTIFLALFVFPSWAQEDVTRTGAEVLEESFEDVGTDFDVLIEAEREDILNQRGTGGIGDDILVDAPEGEQQPGGQVSLEDLVDFEVSVRGIPMPPGGSGSPSSSQGGDPTASLPQSGQSGQSGEQQGQAGQQGGQQGEGQEGEGEGEGQEGEGEGQQGEGQEGEGQEGDQEGGQSQQSGGGGGGASPTGGVARTGSGGGGGGDTSPDPDDIPDGQDDDIVARQLRELAENETDPELKEKLWDEYRRYKAGT